MEWGKESREGLSKCFFFLIYIISCLPVFTVTVSVAVYAGLVSYFKDFILTLQNE